MIFQKFYDQVIAQDPEHGTRQMQGDWFMVQTSAEC